MPQSLVSLSLKQLFMQITDNSSFTRWIIIIISSLLLLLIVWNTYYLFQTFKAEEYNKMKLWVSAVETIANAPIESKELALPQSISDNNTTIPIILADGEGQITSWRNIDDTVMKDSLQAYNRLEQFKSDNKPLAFEYLPGEFQYVYYGNSELLNVLKYYPFVLILIIVLFGAMIYNFYRATKIGTQNRLWAGMAKETAHQIGTPLSSLLGWIEIMKADNVDDVTVTEIEKDVNRLQTIAERFSKIGSEPVLEPLNIITETERSFEYLKSRASKQVEFTFKAPPHNIPVMLNPELHSWTIENLVKNAIDAMKGKGKLAVVIEENEKFVKIKVTDTGKGIPKAQFRKVFEPGFTTKKRGWGLGLSLTRRIVEEYHKGKIKVHNSEIGKGTTMQASFKKA